MEVAFSGNFFRFGPSVDVSVLKVESLRIYEKGYTRGDCWPCLQDMFYKDSRLFTLQEQHPNMYKTVKKKFGKQMMDLLKVWADLEDRNLTEEHLDGLYRTCEFGMLNERHKGKKKAKKLKQKEQPL